MLQQAYRFRLDGEPIFCGRFGRGHINETYILLDETGRQYILKKINGAFFADPASLMGNIAAVTAHLRKTAARPREVLTLVPAVDGEQWLVDEAGAYWRLYDFVSDSLSLDRAETPDDFRESAVAFGLFQRRLADFDAAQLTETIPHFHDTPKRYGAFRAAVAADARGRAKGARREIDFALERENYASLLMDLLGRGACPCG